MSTTDFASDQILWGGMGLPDGYEFAAQGTLTELLDIAKQIQALDLWVSPTGIGDNPVEIPLP